MTETDESAIERQMLGLVAAGARMNARKVLDGHLKREPLDEKSPEHAQWEKERKRYEGWLEP
jgi:hypothetical protein